jgi:hypothetical protein
MSIENQIIQMTSYQLTDSAEAFTQAITALSKRTLDKGPANILRYSFYVSAGDGTAGAIIVFQDPEAWLGQHEFVTSLDEYRQFYKTVRLAGLRFFGDLSPEIRRWLDKRNLEYEYAGPLAAGFER